MYKESLVVFLDVLGVKESVRKSESDRNQIEYIAKMLAYIQEAIRGIIKGAKKSWKKEFNAFAFSDSIMISCPEISRESFIYMAHIIAVLQYDLMRQNFFIRGGLSAGGHYEKGKVFFGPAFLAAYELEDKAVWARVIVDPVVLIKLGQDVVTRALESYMLRDENGLCYLSYLHLLIVQAWVLQGGRLAKGNLVRHDFSRLRRHKESLLNAVEGVNNERRNELLPKYHALANYHNNYVRELYKGLPTQRSYKEVDPTTATGQIISDIRAFASSRESMTDNRLDEILHLYVNFLREDRKVIKELEINLPDVFPSMYP